MDLYTVTIEAGAIVENHKVMASTPFDAEVKAHNLFSQEVSSKALDAEVTSCKLCQT